MIIELGKKKLKLAKCQNKSYVSSDKFFTIFESDLSEIVDCLVLSSFHYLYMVQFLYVIILYD